MKITGQILKEAREAKSISLQEISIHLKINTKTLKALELGDTNQLPAKTFLRGFVQSYAQFLRLDLDQIMEVFQEEMGSTHPSMITTQIAQPPANYGTLASHHQAPANTMNAHFQSMPKTPQTETTISPTKNSSQNKAANPNNTNSSNTNTTTPKNQINEPLPPSISFDPQTWSHSLKIGTAVLVLLIISVIIGIKKTIDKYEREATLPTQESPTDSDALGAPNASATSIANTTATSEGTIPSNLNISQEALSLTSKPVAQPEASPALATPTALNISAVATPTPIGNNANNSSSPATASINSGATAPTPASTSAGASTTTAATKTNPLAVTSSPQPSPALTETSNNSPQEIIIEALDRVVVEYSIDDGPKNSISLLAEKIHTFKAKKNISLSFSDGGSINLIHNGKDKGVPGNLGQPYVVSFPK